MPYNMPKTQAFNCDGLIMLTSQEPTIILDINRIFPSILTGSPYVIMEIDMALNAFQNNPELSDYILNNLYINGTALKEQKAYGTKHYYAIRQNGKSKNGIFTLYVNEFNLNNNFSFNIYVYAGNIIDGRITLSGLSKAFLLYHINNASLPDLYSKHANIIGDDSGSYMMLRANPYLSGNIKVVYEDDIVYIDTFKAYTTDELRELDSKLPKQLDFAKNYIENVHLNFGTISSDALFHIKDSYNNLNRMVYDYSDAYLDDYDYGVSVNTNIKYKSQFKILAPLYIQYHVPDYFIIFRRDISENLQSLISKDAEVIKVIDLRESTQLGKYLRDWCETCKSYAHTLMTDPNTGDEYYNNGLSYTMGKILEHSAFFKLPYDNAETFMMNMMNTANERSHIHPNIINLEFMFNDDTANNYDIHNYYGLYVYEHNIQTVAHILNTSLTNTSRINSASYYNAYDTDRNIIDIRKSILDILDNPDMDGRMFAMSTSKTLEIVKNENDVTSFIKNNVVNNPEKPIGSTLISLCDLNNKNIDSFITITFDREIHSGEHFRIIQPLTNKGMIGACNVYEFIASDDSRLLRYKMPVGHYVLTNQIDDINIYSIPFYVHKDDTKSGYAPLKEQLERLSFAVAKMDNVINVYNISDNSIAIYSNNKNLVFQHIVEPNLILDNDYIHYYNPYHNTKLINAHRYDTFAYYAYNNPITEINSTRYSSISSFIDFNIFDKKYVYEISSDYDDIINGAIAPLYSHKPGVYYSLTPVNVMENSNAIMSINNSNIDGYTLYSIISPFDTSKRLICTDKEININNKQCTLYYTSIFNFSVLGISNVKDIIADVYKPVTHAAVIRYGRFFRETQVYSASLYKEYTNLYSDTVNHTSLGKVGIPANTGINLKNFKEIQKFSLYKVTYGNLKGDAAINKNAVVMFISDTELLYRNSGAKNMQHFIFYDNVTDTNYLYTTLGDVGEKYAELFELLDSNIYDLDYDITLHYLKYRAANLLDDSGTSENYQLPLVPNMSLMYKYTGLDKYYSYDTRPVDNIGLYEKMKLDYTVNEKLLSKHYNVYSNLLNNSIDGYVKYSLNDIIEIDGTYMTVRDYITSGYTNAITLLYKKYLKTAHVHVDDKTNKNTCNFIYNGLYYTISFNSDEVTQNLIYNYTELELFEAIVVFDYDPDRNTEIFVSSDERIILIVEHQSYKNTNQYRARSIKYVDNEQTEQYTSVNYYWYDAPYTYEFINAVSLTDQQHILYKNYNVDIISTDDSYTNTYAFVLTGYPIYNHIVDFSETGYMCTILNYNTFGSTLKSINSTCDFINTPNIWLSENITTDNKLNIGQCINKKSFYHYFLYASRYNEKHPDYINIDNDEDGLIYDMVDKSDQRTYKSYILCTINDTLMSYNEDEIDDNILYNLNNNECELHFIMNGTYEHVDDVNATKYPGFNFTVIPTENENAIYTSHYELNGKDIVKYDIDDKPLSKLTGIDFTYANTHISGYDTVTRTLKAVYKGDTTKVPYNSNISYMYTTQSLDTLQTPWSANSVYPTVLDKFPGTQNIEMKDIALWPKMFFGSFAYVTPKIFNIREQVGLFNQYITYHVTLKNRLTIDIAGILTSVLISNPEISRAYSRIASITGVDKNTMINNFVHNHVLPLYLNKNIQVILYGVPIYTNIFQPPQASWIRGNGNILWLSTSRTNWTTSSLYSVSLSTNIDAKKSIQLIEIKFTR